ncbi:MAG: Fur family zinc uptake transcriptional regulator [Granulosicoccus sp.]|jgi:Fur family zinc uptake transcriptional regulator
MNKHKRPADWHTKVLAVLSKNRGALSAYEVLDELKVFNPKIAPPTVYRALNALAERGQVHRLELMNAYVASRYAEHQHAPVFSVCEQCGQVEECLAPQVMSALSDVTGQTGFTSTHQVIELYGRCISCRDEVTS